MVASATSRHIARADAGARADMASATDGGTVRRGGSIGRRLRGGCGRPGFLDIRTPRGPDAASELGI